MFARNGEKGWRAEFAKTHAPKQVFERLVMKMDCHFPFLMIA